MLLGGQMSHKVLLAWISPESVTLGALVVVGNQIYQIAGIDRERDAVYGELIGLASLVFPAVHSAENTEIRP